MGRLGTENSRPVAKPRSLERQVWSAVGKWTSAEIICTVETSALGQGLRPSSAASGIHRTPARCRDPGPSLPRAPGPCRRREARPAGRSASLHRASSSWGDSASTRTCCFREAQPPALASGLDPTSCDRRLRTLAGTLAGVPRLLPHCSARGEQSPMVKPGRGIASLRLRILSPCSGSTPTQCYELCGCSEMKAA
jgi:hypothetical protein